jgi:hypothetical protein
MQLNLPILEQLSSCKNLLIAGMGGGFDIFCGLPIYFELQNLGLQVHLANLSFSDIIGLKDGAIAGFNQGIQITDTLVGITADTESLNSYFPELYLAQWFRNQRQQNITIWCFEKTGVRPLLDNYNRLIEHLSIDGILLIDGGVDSLIRGDETQMGTVIEDAISLLAVSSLTQVPLKLIACIGLGAERDISYAHVLENIAALAETGGFLGSCSLLKQMTVYQAYEEAVFYVHNQPLQEPSIINASIISAVQGHYGDYHLTERTKGSKLWISPLMPIYWFFDLQAVAKRNLFLSTFPSTDTIVDAMKALYHARGKITKRPVDNIQLN